MPRSLTEQEVSQFRQQLLAIAEQCFARDGINGVSMRQLAQKLGCSATTPYRYFRDKNEILAAVQAMVLHRFSESLEAAFASPGDSLAKAGAVREAYVRFAFNSPEAYRLIFDLPHPDQMGYPDLDRAAKRAERCMTAPLEMLVRDGLVKGDPALLGHVFWGAIHGVVSLKLAGKLRTQPKFEAVLHESLRLIVTGAQAVPTLAVSGAGKSKPSKKKGTQ